MDSEVVDAIKAAGKPYVPIVGADRGRSSGSSSIRAHYPDLKGIAVNNPPPSVARASSWRCKLLNGETVETDPAENNTVLLDPVLADNLTDDGKAKLDSWQSVEGLDRAYPVGLESPA